ncbi:MAG: glycosyltransferase [Bacteroidales bacterium]|nr:glycosyltransferase [Bacteroidales bacterium]
MMKIFGVVVLYYPNIYIVMRNIEAYISHITYLLVWDNTPTQEAEPAFRRQLEDRFGRKVIFVTTGKNEGLSLALNDGIRKAKEKGCSHLLTMDQDSYWENFGFYVGAIEKLEDAVFCPNYRCPGYDMEFCTTNTRIDYNMQSGSIYPLRIFDEIGIFKEHYFIDAIETEFCIRARQNGFPVIRVGNAVLQHEFGKPIRRFGIRSSNYSPFRTYYQVRNHIAMRLEYKAHMPYELVRLMERVLAVILIEREKWPKLKAIVRGFVHGLTDRRLAEKPGKIHV